MMKKIFLHIGLSKTGTTTIQTFLCINRDILLEDGYTYPKIGIPNQAKAHHNLAWIITKRRQGSLIYGTWEELHKEVEQNNLNNIVISSEFFQAVHKQQIDILKSQLKSYEVKIIVYLRRQDLRLESEYTQNLKRGHYTLDISSYIEKKIRGKFQYYDYYQFLKLWEQTFGMSNIIVRPLEKTQIPNICHDFLNIIEINNQKNYIEIENKNIKPGIKAIEALKLANKIYDNTQQEIKEEYLKKIIFFIEKSWNDEKNYRLLSYSQSSKILKSYEESNQAVAKEYLGREDGILFYDRLEPYENQKFELKDLTQEELLGLIKFIKSTKEFQNNQEELSNLIEAISVHKFKKNNLDSIDTKEVQSDEYINRENKHQQQESIDRSLESHKKATELNSNSAPALSKLAAIYEEQKNWIEATQCYQKIISLKPKNHAAYRKLAKVLTKQNQIDNAIAAYQKAIALKSDQPAIVYKNLGDLFTKNEKLDMAISCYQKALEIKPEATKIYRLLGNILTKQGKTEEAKNYYEKTI